MDWKPEWVISGDGIYRSKNPFGGCDAHLPVSYLIPCRKRIIICILSPNANVRTRDVWVLCRRCAFPSKDNRPIAEYNQQDTRQKVLLFQQHNTLAFPEKNSDGVMIKSPHTILKKTRNFRFTNRSFLVWCGAILSSLVVIELCFLVIKHIKTIIVGNNNSQLIAINISQ